MRGMRELALVCLAASALACSADAPVAPKATPVDDMSDIAGRYGLMTVNDRSLPQVIRYDASGAMDALSGVIEMTPDARFMDILTLRRRGSMGIQIQIDTLRGSFLRAARTVMFVPDDDAIAPYMFDLHDGKLTAFDAVFTIVYERH